MSKISIMVEMAPPSQNNQDSQPAKKSVESEVRDALECIESGFDSNQEWLFINSVYKSLKELKSPSDRAQNLIEMIEPVLKKYGYHGVSSKG